MNTARIRNVVFCLFVALIAVGPLQLFAAPLITAREVLSYTNVERSSRGLPVLAENTMLSLAAARKLQDLFAYQYFAHESPSGKDVSDLVDETGYRYITVGENLALGDFASSKAVVDAWMNSPGHRANILSKNYSEIGIAVGKGEYKGSKTWIAVQSFGLPRSACPASDQALRADLAIKENVLKIMKRIVEYRRANIETSTGSATRLARVEGYNTSVELYNKRVREYRKLVVKYNASVDAFNACVKSHTSSAVHE